MAQCFAYTFIRLADVSLCYGGSTSLSQFISKIATEEIMLTLVNLNYNLNLIHQEGGSFNVYIFVTETSWWFRRNSTVLGVL